MITEIKDELSSIKSNLNTKLIQIKHKTILKNILENINSFECFLNSKMINIYQRPWKQLESELKK